ncbi:hypothetical protein [Paenibacillus sp. Soil724D2]|uniref:hypothetical protein n=1 Tax=Paenibacillus sp. (strain Soil724D2) TaxID=1736392 RepID=UPI000713C4EA|nr:hypothetical protein [Paenibacillus sp. Soil724D2]KRE48408.1 hypothetical protein ASG85_05235 [Paenibacillus sp. Soil724D2]
METKKDDIISLFIPALSEITEKGIKYKDKYYSCHWAVRNQWFQLSSNTRILKVFVDTANEDYLLITLENGCLDIALQIQHYKVDGEKLDEYYQLLDNIKKQLKARKRKRM